MNEPVIHDSTPKGSAIVAYGESSRPKTLSVILLVIPGLTLLFGIGLMLWTMFSATIPVPEDVVMLAYVTPGAALPDGSPDVWRDAKLRAGSFPIFIGLRLDRDASRRAFVITPRIFRSDAAQTSWIWQLIDEVEPTRFARQTPHSIVSGWNDYRAPAWVRVWPGRLAQGTEPAERDDRSVGGPVTSHRWTTDLTAPTDLPERDRITGQNFLDMRALPESWRLLETAFRVYDLSLHLKTVPSAAYWSLDGASQLSLALDFKEPMDAETKVDLAGAAGLSDRVAYTLPDGTVVTENRLPTETLSQTTSSEWTLDGGRRIIFSEHSVLLGDPELLSLESPVPEECRGRVLAVFNPLSTRHVFDALGFPYLPMSALVLLEDHGNVVACW